MGKFRLCCGANSFNDCEHVCCTLKAWLMCVKEEALGRIWTPELSREAGTKI